MKSKEIKNAIQKKKLLLHIFLKMEQTSPQSFEQGDI